jgi:putative membrane protein
LEFIIFFSKREIPILGSDVIKLTDTIDTNKVFEITPENYTNILQAVTNDIDSYVGCKIHFTGYVYRLIDFDENEFVLARDMLINENTSQSLIVGFLCTYDTAYEFKDDTWVDIKGTIVKGDYYGDIAQIQVESMTQCDEPENKYVSVPDDTYIPTSNMF